MKNVIQTIKEVMSSVPEDFKENSENINFYVEKDTVFKQQRAQVDRAYHDDDRPRGPFALPLSAHNALDRPSVVSDLRLPYRRGLQIHKKQEKIFSQHLFARRPLSDRIFCRRPKP